MPKLTQTQRIILEHAALRAGGAVLPLPTSLTTTKGAAAAVLKPLLKKGLVAEQQVTENEPASDRKTTGDRPILTITAAGRQAVTDLAGEGQSVSKARRRPSRKRGKVVKQRERQVKGAESAPGDRPATKQTTLIGLMRRPAGATIEELTAATGWQAHSVRGAISGTLKKKRRLTFITAKDKRGARRYRIVERS